MENIKTGEPPLEFFKGGWCEMTEEQQIKVVRQASPTFLHEHWEELSKHQRLIALGDGFLTRLPCELLPKYQTSRDANVRRCAEDSFRECLKRYSAEELPNYLTDPDPTIRQIARELMNDVTTNS